jgi:Flp pilus assembly protein TadD
MAASETTKAVAFLDAWLKKYPADAVALKLFAEAQFRNGQLDAAKKTYQKAVAVDPNDAPTLNNYANLLLRLNEPEALSVADKAVRLAPGVAVFTDTLGWIHVKQGQPEIALRYLREARLRSPENREIRFHLAYALAKTGRNAEAREELGVALNGLKHPPESMELAELKKLLGWQTP